MHVPSSTSFKVGLNSILRAVYVGRGGGGRRGSDEPPPPFWWQILYISFMKCKGRDQCKKNPLKN